jgi:hypothetical protein
MKQKKGRKEIKTRKEGRIEWAEVSCFRTVAVADTWGSGSCRDVIIPTDLTAALPRQVEISQLCRLSIAV